jgi:hypothetical protein
MLSWGFKDFRTKSTGDTGEDGVTWAPVKTESIVNRVRGLKAYKTKAAAVRVHRRKLREGKAKLRKARALLQQSARGSAEYRKHAATIKKARKAIGVHSRRLARARNATSEGEHKAAVAKAKGSGKALVKAKAQLTAAKAARAAIRGQVPKEHHATIRKLEARVERAKAAKEKYLHPILTKAKIGIDTGRLVNSEMFGVPELKMRPMSCSGRKLRPGEQPQQEAIFETDHSSVTVGASMNYAKFFDEQRPIFGANFLNPERAEKLGDLAAKATEIFLKQAAERKPPGKLDSSDLATE